MASASGILSRSTRGMQMDTVEKLRRKWERAHRAAIKAQHKEEMAYRLMRHAEFEQAERNRMQAKESAK